MEVELIQQLNKADSAIKGTSLITLYIPSAGNL